ncbi:MAG: Uma2 family endonuclease [bacterium]
MSVELLKRRFTVEEYERMGQAGILSEDDRVELIEGEIIEMAPIGPPHSAVATRLNAVFVGAVGTRALVRVAEPLRLGAYSMPQPDLLLAKPREDYYASGHPQAEDIILVVEIAETTLAYDRGIKVPLYARTGVPEVWLVALPEEMVQVFRQPSTEGYRSVTRLKHGDIVHVQALPEVALTAEQILGEKP